MLGQAAFSTALQCVDLMTLDEQGEPQWVCLKVGRRSRMMMLMMMMIMMMMLTMMMLMLMMLLLLIER